MPLLPPLLALAPDDDAIPHPQATQGRKIKTLQIIFFLYFLLSLLLLYNVITNVEQTTIHLLKRNYVGPLILIYSDRPSTSSLVYNNHLVLSYDKNGIAFASNQRKEWRPLPIILSGDFKSGYSLIPICNIKNESPLFLEDSLQACFFSENVKNVNGVKIKYDLFYIISKKNKHRLEYYQYRVDALVDSVSKTLHLYK
jgi:hypothetical protein